MLQHGMHVQVHRIRAHVNWDTHSKSCSYGQECWACCRHAVLEAKPRRHILGQQLSMFHPADMLNWQSSALKGSSQTSFQIINQCLPDPLRWSILSSGATSSIPHTTCLGAAYDGCCAFAWHLKNASVRGAGTPKDQVIPSSSRPALTSMMRLDHGWTLC